MDQLSLYVFKQSKYNKMRVSESRSPLKHHVAQKVEFFACPARYNACLRTLGAFCVTP